MTTCWFEKSIHGLNAVNLALSARTVELRSCERLTLSQQSGMPRNLVELAEAVVECG